MKAKYDYKVLSVWPGSYINEYELNAIGSEGYRLVMKHEVLDQSSGPEPTVSQTQFIFEKVIDE